MSQTIHGRIMQKKLTITIDENVYYGLKKIIGPGKISKFIEDLVRPHVINKSTEAAYLEMAEDTKREKGALKWAELFMKDADNEAW